MSSSGINFSGLGSGIDTESIISQLMKLRQQPITDLQTQGKKIQQQQTAVNQVASLVAGIQAAASTLSTTTGFSGVTSTSTDQTVATISTQSGAGVGDHTLQVTQLAQSERLGSATLTSQTDALGVSGQIVINGKAVTVQSSDTLQVLASNINAAQAGVNASIVSTNTGSYTLVLSSQHSGTANSISLSDTAGGSILRTTLGLIGAGTSVRNAITNGAASDLFADSSTSIGTLIGLTSPQAGTIQINGQNVDIDFGTDSLTSIAGKINSAGITGVSASVVTAADPVSGASKQQLKITGSSTPTFTDSNNILTNLGVLKNARTNTLAAARDATFNLDGLAITRSSNTVTDVLSGATIVLLKDTGSPTTQLSISADLDGVKKGINGLVGQYNQLINTVDRLASYDPETKVAGPLFGDITMQTTVDSITEMLTESVPGLSGLNNIAQLGITLDQSGQLVVDDTKLSNALASNLSGAARLFEAMGTSTDSSISYISSTEKTKASLTGGYAVNITQLPVQAGITSGTDHTANDNPDVETLTFSGSQFGAGKTILINANSTLDDMVAQLNADTTLSGLLTASKSGSKLMLTAKLYGSGQNFTVVSSQPAAANNSGIGTTPLTGTGVDVAGTIGGEATTGNGQFLTGAVGNANTEGLQIRVTSTSTGAKGTISFAQGLAARLKYFANDSTDLLTGTLTKYASTMDDAITELNSQISDLNDQNKAYEQNLRDQFAAMDSAVASIKSAGTAISAIGK